MSGSFVENVIGRLGLLKPDADHRVRSATPSTPGSPDNPPYDAITPSTPGSPDNPPYDAITPSDPGSPFLTPTDSQYGDILPSYHSGESSDPSDGNENSSQGSSTGYRSDREIFHDPDEHSSQRSSIGGHSDESSYQSDGNGQRDIGYAGEAEMSEEEEPDSDDEEPRPDGEANPEHTTHGWRRRKERRSAAEFENEQRKAEEKAAEEWDKLANFVDQEMELSSHPDAEDEDSREEYRAFLMEKHLNERKRNPTDEERLELWADRAEDALVRAVSPNPCI
jgi:hypothetical protein